MRLSAPDGVPAGFVDVRFQLAPGQHEPSLFVEFLFARDAVALIILASCIVSFAQVFEKAVDPLMRRRDGTKVAHRRIRLSQSGVTASRSHRRSAGAARQSGSSKFPAASTMR